MNIGICLIKGDMAGNLKQIRRMLKESKMYVAGSPARHLLVGAAEAMLMQVQKDMAS
jgi:hypothetical protein